MTAMDDDDFELLDADEATTIFGSACMYLLNDDEGIVIENNGEMFVVWYDRTEHTMKISPWDPEVCYSDESGTEKLDPAKIRSGQLVHMHFTGDTGAAH